MGPLAGLRRYGTEQSLMRILMLVSIIALIPCLVRAQAPLPPEQRELFKAQTQLTKVQAEYYKGQLEVYRRQIEAQIAQQKPLTWKQKLFNDPADTVGAAGTVLGAFLILALFALNGSSSRRFRRDTQFYEALKRFGDEGSPFMRSSAAGILAQMGKHREFTLWWQDGRFGWQSPYRRTALDQLKARLSMEENASVVEAIEGAVEQLAHASQK